MTTILGSTKTILKSIRSAHAGIRWYARADTTHLLLSILVDDVHAMPPAMASGNSARLIETTNSHTASHRGVIIRAGHHACTEISATAEGAHHAHTHAHRDLSTLDTTMSCRVADVTHAAELRSRKCGGHYLVGGDLLLKELLLLLLESFDLVLEGNLCERDSEWIYVIE